MNLLVNVDDMPGVGFILNEEMSYEQQAKAIRRKAYILNVDRIVVKDIHPQLNFWLSCTELMGEWQRKGKKVIYIEEKNVDYSARQGLSPIHAYLKVTDRQLVSLTGTQPNIIL